MSTACAVFATLGLFALVLLGGRRAQAKEGNILHCVPSLMLWTANEVGRVAAQLTFVLRAAR